MESRRLRAWACGALALAAGAFAALPSSQAHAASCAPTQYTVQRGDVLWRIAWQHQTNIWALARINHLKDPNLILVNQCLTVNLTANAPPAAPNNATATQATHTSSSTSSHAPQQSARTTGSWGQASGGGDMASILTQAANANGISPALVKAIAWVESGWNPRAESYAGAMGLMQLMPATAAMLNRELGTHYDVWSAYGNAQMGARFLRDLLAEEHGCLTCAISAYNQGAGNFARRGYSNWSWYVAPVLAAMKRFH